MNLEFKVSEIVATNMDSVIPFLFKRSPKDTREEIRLYERHEAQYKMFKWLSWQLQRTQILDLGVRYGTSALCLADNPSNRVIGVDIGHIFKGVDVRPYLAKRDIDFFELDVNDLASEYIRFSPVISLDISHNGADEAKFLQRLIDMNYNGIVIMDDICKPSTFPELAKVWNEITLPKIRLPDEISHDTGTGVVIFGDHNITVGE